MLTSKEQERLREAIAATIAAPIIGAIEDYSWEAIFHYVKNIPLSDPALGRTKLLHDAVDFRTKTGWSLKTVQLPNLTPGTPFQFIIQRADVFTKATALGFPGLNIDSSPSLIGEAVIRHWNEKFLQDSQLQGVINSYEGILLKRKRAGIEYIYAEYPILAIDPTTFSWAWSVKNVGTRGEGLQGRVGGKLSLIWYRNQKQLFKVQTIPEQPVLIRVQRERLTPDEYVETILSALQRKPSFEQAAQQDDSL